MTRFPREPLDAEERALAARLPRPHGRDEPGAGIDARILAAAHAAAASPLPAAARRRHWGVPVGLAAALCLAVGLAWRVQLTPDARPVAASAEAQQAADAPATVTALPRDTVDVPQQPRPTPEAAPAAVPPPAHRRAVVQTAPLREEMPPPPDTAAPASGIAPAPASAFPAPPAPPPPADSAAPRALAIESAARAAAPPPATMAAKAGTAQPAVLAQDTDDAPEADVPPATADAPEVREAWLRRIGELQREGRTAEARASLAEFRRRYPDAVLPMELRALEAAATEPATH
jgi:hypothetical protein